jgi:hypothetical protein
MDDSQRTVVSTTTTPITANDRLVAHVEFPAASIAPGVYELKATILVAGQTVGTTSAPIQKAGRSDCEAEVGTCAGIRATRTTGTLAPHQH